MSYFAPYLDETGLHIPTYADRLAAMLDACRTIFGADYNLTESSPDYQLLSIFARALDDFSAALVSLFASRNPAYAAGAALDLLLPLHGITRDAGESDASARRRLALASSAPSRTIAESMADALAAVPNVAASRLIVNDTDL